MKTLFKKSIFLLFAGVLFIGCAGKEGAPGPQGSTGLPGPSASAYSFTLTFSPTVKSGYTTGLIGKADNSDAVLIYFKSDVIGNVDHYTLLPFTFPVGANAAIMYAEVGDNGNVFIQVDKLDGTTGSPFTSSGTLYFKAIVIKGEAGTRVASVDYSDYKAVKAYYNLKD